MQILRRLYRRTRRALYALSQRQSVDVDQHNKRIVCALYTQIAKDLGLQVSMAGRVVCITRAGRTFRLLDASTDFDTWPACAICGDKTTCRELFERHALRVPRGKTFPSNDVAGAVEFALSLQKPCVVKPAFDTSGSKGVTLNVRSPRQIRRAVRHAGLFCEAILVEEFIPGNNYRFLVYKGRCLSVVLRQLPHVIGNGRDAIRTLVAHANTTRIRKSDWSPGDPVLMPLRLDRSARRLLRMQALSIDSVPPLGHVVPLAESCGFRFGASYLDVTDHVHPTLLAASVKAAAAVGVELAGVDIISSDVTSENYYINEINTTPGIDVHYIISNTGSCKDPIRTILKDYFGLS